MTSVYIYSLADPISGQIRYVGKTANIAQRLAAHLKKNEATRKGCWIRGLRKKGLKPLIDLLDIVPEEEWQFWEVYWIAQLKAWGIRLLNGDNGGLGAHRLTDEIKGKISQSLTGKPNLSLSRRVCQYDLQGNYLQTFASLNQAAIAIGDSHANISRSIKKGVQVKGYLFIKEHGEPARSIDTNYNERGVAIGSIQNGKRVARGNIGRFVGRVVSHDTRAKQRLARLGKTPVNKGLKASESFIQKMKEISVSRKAVMQLTLNGDFVNQFDSVKEASISTNIARASISRAAKASARQAGGYRWKYI